MYYLHNKNILQVANNMAKNMERKKHKDLKVKGWCEKLAHHWLKGQWAPGHNNKQGCKRHCWGKKKKT